MPASFFARGAPFSSFPVLSLSSVSVSILNRIVPFPPFSRSPRRRDVVSFCCQTGPDRFFLACLASNGTAIASAFPRPVSVAKPPTLLLFAFERPPHRFSWATLPSSAPHPFFVNSRRCPPMMASFLNDSSIEIDVSGTFTFPRIFASFRNFASAPIAERPLLYQPNALLLPLSCGFVLNRLSVFL